MLLSKVFVSKLNTTLLTLDIRVHLKPLGITERFHRDLNGNTTLTSQRVGVAICVPLSSELTSTHEMVTQENGATKDDTIGGVLASESGESRHAGRWPPAGAVPSQLVLFLSP